MSASDDKTCCMMIHRPLTYITNSTSQQPLIEAYMMFRCAYECVTFRDPHKRPGPYKPYYTNPNNQQPLDTWVAPCCATAACLNKTKGQDTDTTSASVQSLSTCIQHTTTADFQQPEHCHSCKLHQYSMSITHYNKHTATRPAVFPLNTITRFPGCA
jgi:hypothetical protein